MTSTRPPEPSRPEPVLPEHPREEPDDPKAPPRQDPPSPEPPRKDPPPGPESAPVPIVGHFRAVVREVTPDATAILTGRVAAIEEVDLSRKAWQGRIVVELRLVDATTGVGLWTAQYEEIEPLVRQSPEGLAEALSRAMARIAAAAGPEIAAHVAAPAPASAAAAR